MFKAVLSMVIWMADSAGCPLIFGAATRLRCASCGSGPAMPRARSFFQRTGLEAKGNNEDLENVAVLNPGR